MDEVTREAPGHTEEGLDREALIHDLRIHQVELELQNDELRNAYARLEETGREYTDLFERAPLGLVVVDRHGMIVRCNESFRALLSSDEPLAGRPLADLVTTESALTWRGRFRAFFANPAEKRVDLELQTRNSTRRVIRLVGRTMKTLPAGGPPVAKNVGDLLMLVAFEVTEEITAREERQELLAEKDLLLRELRHRTQNHLLTIQSLLSFQAGHSRDPAVAEALATAQDRIRAMLLVNEILTSRADQQKVELSAYLEDLIRGFRDMRPESSRITVRTDLERVPVSADIGYILGLIVNELLTNAFKYAFPARRSGEVSVSLRREPLELASLLVVDNGIGMESVAPAPEGGGDAAELEARDSGGVGFHLVRGLAGQIGGAFSIERSVRGTSCRVTFGPGRE
jgi:two-component system, sensor histidine kinase PdtaS